ncbi:hypothetical protein KEM55_001562 [Ascosphaera atra]|nr:hypothetical protein KEM55_001562 [Ascosphaera atra]
MATMMDTLAGTLPRQLKTTGTTVTSITRHAHVVLSRTTLKSMIMIMLLTMNLVMLMTAMTMILVRGITMMLFAMVTTNMTRHVPMTMMKIMSLTMVTTITTTTTLVQSINVQIHRVQNIIKTQRSHISTSKLPLHPQYIDAAASDATNDEYDPDDDPLDDEGRVIGLDDGVLTGLRIQQLRRQNGEIRAEVEGEIEGLDLATLQGIDGRKIELSLGRSKEEVLRARSGNAGVEAKGEAGGRKKTGGSA